MRITTIVSSITIDKPNSNSIFAAIIPIMPLIVHKFDYRLTKIADIDICNDIISRDVNLNLNTTWGDLTVHKNTKIIAEEGIEDG